MSMWNSKKYLTIAVLSAGLGVAAAAPASAQCGGWGGWGGGFGSAGWGGGWGGGCGGWGGGFGSAGWGGGWGGGFGTPVILVPIGGFGGWGGGGWGGGFGGWGGGFGSTGWGGGWGGWGNGFGFGCRRHHRASGYGGYTTAYLPRHYHSYTAYAAYAPRSHHRALYASVRGLKHHFASVKRNVRFG
jgi:hypothetical protein